MKIGSLVECINHLGIDLPSWYKKPISGSNYTVTGFYQGGRGLGIFIEECEDDIYCVHKDGSKVLMPSPFLMSRFREVLPQMEISIESIIQQDVQHGL